MAGNGNGAEAGIGGVKVAGVGVGEVNDKELDSLLLPYFPYGTVW